jgi:hypothetical protein
VRAIWPQSAGWAEDSDELGNDLDGAVATNDPRINRDAADDDEDNSRYTPDTGFGVSLFDACNAFQELNQYLMLWNVAHRWHRGSRFAFNRYHQWGICLVHDEPGKEALVIHSKEGITQGDCFAMSLYGVALLPLATRMREVVPHALQPWYADDAGAAGEARWNAACLNYLVRHGPRYGYFFEPDKSYHVCREEDETTAWEAFATLELDMNFVRGRRYLGGFIGSAATKGEWLGDMVATWTAAVETLAVNAEKHPQTAYAGFAFSLQKEWQYLQ